MGIIITTQMLVDKLHFKGPMSIEALIEALGAKKPEDRATVLTLVRIASQGKRINLNVDEKIVWTTPAQFNSCE